MSRDYELAFILTPEVSEEETRAILERIEQVVAAHNGQIVRVNQWGRRRLAYPIQRHRDGFYIFIDMILTPESVAELDRTLKVSEIVIRYMIRKRDAKAVQKEREEREEREARAAAAAANAPATTPAPAEEQPVAEQAAASEEVPVLTDEDLSDVPAAIEGEETVEA